MQVTALKNLISSCIALRGKLKGPTHVNTESNITWSQTLLGETLTSLEAGEVFLFGEVKRSYHVQ